MLDKQTIERNRTRYLIVGTGRSGSSLLAAILAHAGADFGMDNQTEWSRRGGAYEHPLLISAHRWYLRSNRLKTTVVPYPVSEYCLNRAKKQILQLSRQARFAKYPPATYIVHLFKSVSLFPVVIIAYRSFETYAASSYLRSGFTFTELADRYVDRYQTALLQLYLYGGCVVDYGDLIDPSQTDWAQSLSDLTNVEFDKLMTARETLVNNPTQASPPPQFWDEMMQLDPRPYQMYELLRSLNGQVIQRKSDV